MGSETNTVRKFEVDGETFEIRKVEDDEGDEEDDEDGAPTAEEYFKANWLRGDVHVDVQDNNIRIDGKNVTLWIPYDDGEIPKLAGYMMLPSGLKDKLTEHGIVVADEEIDDRWG